MTPTHKITLPSTSNLRSCSYSKKGVIERLALFNIVPVEMGHLLQFETDRATFEKFTSRMKMYAGGKPNWLIEKL